MTCPNRVNGDSDEIVTQVLAVKNVGAAQLVPVLRPLMPQNAQLSAVTGANILIMSDHASNVNRIMRVIARIDEVGNPDFDVIPLRSATAADTARVLNSLLAQAGEGGNNVKIVADDRSNSILLSGDETLRLRVKTLVAHLDTPIDTGSDTQVRYLRYSDAEDLATRLKEQMSGTNSASSSSSVEQQPQSTLSANAQRPGQHRPDFRRQRPAQQRHRATPPCRWQAAPPRSGRTSRPMRWSSPPATRSMRALNAVIDKLDIRRPQVYVEAIIAEVTVDKTADLGVNWAIDGTNSSVGVGGFVSPIGGTSIVDLANAALGATATSSSTTGTTEYHCQHVRPVSTHCSTARPSVSVDSRQPV
jgi:general secretion pathway protein D